MKSDETGREAGEDRPNRPSSSGASGDRRRGAPPGNGQRSGGSGGRSSREGRPAARGERSGDGDPRSTRPYRERSGGGYGERSGGYAERSGRSYGERPGRPSATRPGLPFSGRGQRTGGRAEGPASSRPARRFEEPGIGDDGGAFSSGASSSLSRAVNTGRNLWTPRPSQARRPGGPSGKPGGGPRRSTNTVGGEQVEGRQAVRELLSARRRSVSEIFLVEGTDPAPILGEIDNLARQNNVPVRMVSIRRLESLQRTETPQGVVAFAEPLQALDLSDLVLESAKEAAPAPFLVVVDGVTDPHNLGAVLRSAECAGATGVVLPRHRAVHVTAAVTKAAAGAVEHLRIALVPGIPSALQSLAELGVKTVGLDERGESSIFDLSLGKEPVSLVLGAEGRGLSPLTRRRCDVLARIPLHGAISSLNVSTAAAVACFEVARGRA